MYLSPYSAGNSCYNCGQPGHISRDCTEERKNTRDNRDNRDNRDHRDRDNNRGRSETKCYGCGGYGHMARDCPSGKRYDIQRQAKPKEDATTAARRVTSHVNVLRRETKTKVSEATREPVEEKAAKMSATTAMRWVILQGSALVPEKLYR